MAHKDLLIVTTSPRAGGNCDDAAKLLSETAGSAETIPLHEFRIERCLGCLNCQKGIKCAIKDDFNKLWERFLAASTIVLIAPVYWCAPPGLFKDFIDRTVVSFGEEPMKGKTLHLVSIAQSAGFGPHEKIIDTWIRWLGGAGLKTKLRLIAFQSGDLAANASAVRKLRQLGASLPASREF